MEFNAAALATLCLGFSTGFLLVLSYIEKPILSLATQPDKLAENEDVIRGVHGFLQSFLNYAGSNVLMPLIVLTLAMVTVQGMERNFDTFSLFVMCATFGLLVVDIVHIRPAARLVQAEGAENQKLEQMTSSLFKLVRMHHAIFLIIVPLTLAQLVLLFI